MSVVDEMRSRSAQSGHRGGSATGLIIGIAAVMAIGAAAAAYFLKPTGYGPSMAIAFTPDRLGNEASAPLFAQCIATKQMPRFNTADPVALEQRAKLYMRDKAVELAECAYEQNIGALCDANNRAFAVETALQMLKHTDPLVEQNRSSRNASYVMVVRERVIASIGARARKGELIARDFGAYPPASLTEVLAPGAQSNVCAK